MGRKLVYIIGAIVIGIATTLAIMFGMIAGDVVDIDTTTIVIESGSASSIYNGQQLTCDSYAIINGELKAGHTAKVVMYGSQTNVGSSPNYMTVTIFDENNTDVSSYYEIIPVLGTLTVEKAPIKVTSDTKLKQYDGTPLTCDTYKLSALSQLAPGHKVDLFFDQNASLTNVGTTENSFTLKIFDEENQDVTANYEVEKEYGLLTVSTKKITITSKSLSKLYDGTPLDGKDSEYLIADNALILGHYPVYTNNSTITNIGIIENEFKCKIVDNKDNDVSSNYTISYEYGTLQIGTRKLTIKTASTPDTGEVYSGQPIKCENFEFIYTSGDDSEKLADGDEIILTYINSRTDVGETDNIATWIIKNANGEDVTENYIISAIFGTIKVKKRDITIESATKEKVYDATPLTNSGSDLLVENVIKEGTIVEGQTLNLNAFASITNVKRDSNNNVTYIANAINPKIFDANGKDVTINYNITILEGKLTITPLIITLASDNGTWEYDGLEHFNDTNPQEDNVLPEGQHFVFDNFNTITNYGTVANTFTYKIVDDENNELLSSNYEIIEYYGTLTIEKLYIQLVSNSGTWIYDGSEHFVDTPPQVDDVLPDGQHFVFSNFNKIIYVGSFNNTFEYKVLDENNNEIDLSNFDFDITYGTITVTKAQLILESGSYEGTYDGINHSNTTAPALDSILPAFHMFTFDNFKTIKNVVYSSDNIVSSIDNTFDVSIYDGYYGKDVTDNFNISYNYGQLKVLPSQLIFDIEGTTREYNGYELTYNVSVTGTIAFGEHYTISYNPSNTSLIYPGTLQTTATVNILTEDNVNNTTSNYSITVNIGQLQVTQADLTIQAQSKSKAYDGTPLTCDEFILTNGFVKDTDFIVVNINDSITNIGQMYNQISAINIYKKSTTATSLLTIKESEALSLYEYNQDGTLKMSGDLYILHEIDNTYEIKVVGFNSDMSKVFVKATKDSTIYQGMVDVAKFVTIENYTLDEDITTYHPYYLRELVGLLRVTTNKETTGLTKEEENAPEYNALSIKAENDGPIYLRSYSYAKFYGDGWSKGDEYSAFLDDKYSYNYLTSALLEELGYTPTSVNIKLENASYVVPYYPVKEATTQSQASDILYAGTDSEYLINYYSVDYDTIKTLIAPIDYQYSSEEDNYYSFVQDQYLQFPDDNNNLKNYLDSLILENSISTIDDVIAFISNAAKYNISYDRNLDKQSDTVIAFLRDYKEGVCSHFAAAATMMLRALNIPARYVSGYYAYAKANDWVTVTNMKRHAWTEVYLENIGWVQIDATAGGIVKNTTPISTLEQNKTYFVKPADFYYKASSIEDGNRTTISSIESSNENWKLIPLRLSGLETLEQKGYTYKKVDISAIQSGFGTSTSMLSSFTLLDPNGYDVTDQFKFTLGNGKVQIYLIDINISTNSVNAVYDGLEHSDSTIKINGIEVEDLDQAATLAGLAPGHSFVTLNASQSQTLVGQTNNTITYRIEDEAGNNVTSYYRISLSCGIISVTPRSLEITAGSNSGIYDKVNKTPVTCSTYTCGELATGDSITEIVIVGSQIKPGQSNNVVQSVTIENSDGIDVTHCYQITTINGTLTVTVA